MSLSDVLTTVQQGVVAANGLVTQAQGSLLNIAGQLGNFRVPLTADTTYFVRADGSDSNNGLTNASSGAFLTTAHAMAAVAAVDCKAFQLTVSVQSGTFTPGVALPRMLASKRPILTGVGSSTFINSTSDAIVADGSTPWAVQNMKLSAVDGGSASGILLKNGGFVAFSGIEFSSASGFGVRAFGFTAFQATGACTVSGGGQGLVISNGFGDMGTAVNWTFNNAVTYSLATVAATKSGGELDANGTVFINSSFVTGSKYFATINGAIFTGTGGSSTFFPGTVAGSVSLGGVYS